ncbi:MAG: LemA family protein [Burkholderiaceae bacterium]|nr:LemA family protein [Burkholderiaceae bacterium]
MWSSSVFWVILAVMLFWAVGAYNRVVRLRSVALQAFGGLDAHWVRMLAMLGECDAAQASAGVPMTQARQSLQTAANEFGAALAVARARPLQADVAATLVAARMALDSAWTTMAAEAGLPDVQGAAVGWGLRWEQHRLQSTLAAEQFNAAVVQYNEAITQFPAQVLARLFGFKTARPV